MILMDIQRASANATKSLQHFSAFVSRTEDYILQFSKTIKNIDEVKSNWVMLEIVNSCALSDWEDMGKPSDASALWDKKYKSDAQEMLNRFLPSLTAGRFGGQGTVGTILLPQSEESPTAFK